MSTSTPVIAIAHFFDDTRIENTGKTILIGQYIGEMIISIGAMPVDRLAVLITARWPRSYTPLHLRLRVEITSQPVMEQAMTFTQNPAEVWPTSDFSSVTIQGILNLRFLPLRSGDKIDVWLLTDDQEIPAGRLYIVDRSAVSPPLDGIHSGAFST